ncbi:MAG: sigma-54 dependent transcriptional regulator [Lentimicrobiaceae bacterium]|nr:sigma-54 dependent transcriptional regulator [Lentimicrobiaceae bacterium]
MDVQAIKLRFGIIGNSPLLNNAIDVAAQVAATDLSVLVTGESGVGKEVFPQIIHHLSTRKHGRYIAVNCGAIPEGTIDSELFGHEKGSFTGATDARKGYFEVADGGTIFLDEVAELPLSTQVRLLRVLESGEFLRVGSSKPQKTDVRVVAATNINVNEAVETGKFRQDLYYRLSSVPIHIPPLRKRKEDIHLIFRKFASDFAEKYRMPTIELDEQAVEMLTNYRWPGNVRQLKNITEQISIIEKNRNINAETLQKYLPQDNQFLPTLVDKKSASELGEREILYKILFDMRKDISDLKKVVSYLSQDNYPKSIDEISDLVTKDHFTQNIPETNNINIVVPVDNQYVEEFQPTEVLEESLQLQHNEKELIKRALAKNNGKRRVAAKELGISERTLYRKIKEYNL